MIEFIEKMVIIGTRGYLIHLLGVDGWLSLFIAFMIVGILDILYDNN